MWVLVMWAPVLAVVAVGDVGDAAVNEFAARGGDDFAGVLDAALGLMMLGRRFFRRRLGGLGIGHRVSPWKTCFKIARRRACVSFCWCDQDAAPNSTAAPSFSGRLTFEIENINL